MFAHGKSSFTRTWMNLGCQKRLQSTSAMTYHASCTHRETSQDFEARDQIPHPLCMGIKLQNPGMAKAVKCPGYARGMLKLRFDRYINSHLQFECSLLQLDFTDFIGSTGLLVCFTGD